MALKILLVDDSITVRAVVKKALELAEVPYDVIHEAGNGVEALAVLDANEIDLVISHIMMPEMDGEQLVTAMRDSGRLARTPVIVVSSAGGEQRLQRLEELGVKGFVHKPFTPEQIKVIVDEVTGVATA